jgi:hypothetical protein
MTVTIFTIFSFTKINWKKKIAASCLTYMKYKPSSVVDYSLWRQVWTHLNWMFPSCVRSHIIAIPGVVFGYIWIECSLYLIVMLHEDNCCATVEFQTRKRKSNAEVTVLCYSSPTQLLHTAWDNESINIYICIYRCGENNRNTKKLRNGICVGYIEKKTQLATLNVLHPSV